MNCECGVEMKLIPAGISKTSGKAYNAFYSCPECKATKNLEPKKVAAPPHATNSHTEDLKAKAMIFAYAKDLVVAQCQAGIAPPDLTKATIAVFNELWAAYKDA